ncbi:hypothetical protein QUF80_01165 [Desulfococcaceae bacterium HSG8]|nr:hypothetical protein [Desulfococcaceae bacterium HSG8]
MKILYVEDELSKNISRIPKLFQKYMGKEIIRRLKELEEDESGYGATPDEIKDIVEETNLIEVEYRFPDALRKVVHDHEKYTLFIIDRNLTKGRYEHEEVRKIDSAYTDEKYEKFSKSNREGDYLLNYLILVHKADVEKKFFFLTAYSAKDELRDSENIENFILMDQFTEKNFIEKGKEEDFERLKGIVDNNEVINLIHENRDCLNILNKNIGEKAAKRFLHVLYRKDSDNPADIAGNLGNLRNILANISAEAGIRFNAPESCRRGDELITRNFFWWLTHDEATKEKIYKFDTNSLLQNFFYSVYQIGSDFGTPHEELSKDKPSGYQPTSDTVNSLIYALKDVISWFGKICSRYPKAAEK